MNFTATVFAVSLLSLLGCRSVEQANSNVEDTRPATTAAFALIGCNSENGWISTDRGNCKRPYRLCYVGSRKNVIDKINSSSVNAEEELGVKNAKMGGGVSIAAEIWDLPNNSKTKR